MARRSSPLSPKGPWAAEETEILRRLYLTHEYADVARILGRSVGSVRTRCWLLGLEKHRPWSEEDLATLRAFYEQHVGKVLPLQRLADQLGRDRHSVAKKARELGLTDNSRPLSQEGRRVVSATMKARIQKDGHPRGALGMKHGPEALRAMSESAKRAWADPSSGHNTEENRQRRSDLAVRRQREGTLLRGEQMYSRAAQGRREDLGGQFFRSSWEANYARFLNLMIERGVIVSWEYEKHTFWFEAIRRGVRSYVPDFRVVYPDGHHEWHEVKGWMDPKSKTKLKRMAKYHPDEIVQVIDKDWFKGCVWSGLAGAIPYWETRAVRQMRTA